MRSPSASGPFADADSPDALLTGFAAIAAMAMQNATQRAYLPMIPPTTFMTGNVTQASIDAVDLMTRSAEQKAKVRTRFARIALNVVCFAAGCAVAALLYWRVGFWSLALALAIACVAIVLRARA